LYQSAEDEFLISGQSLLPPLAALAGLGRSAAENIVAARKERPFSSQEDIRIRGHASKSVLEILALHGCLAGIPESDQLRLFG
jgi:DNA polymerase-3 subunit alpha (Gram-positive type)